MKIDKKINIFIKSAVNFVSVEKNPVLALFVMTFFANLTRDINLK